MLGQLVHIDKLASVQFIYEEFFYFLFQLMWPESYRLLLNTLFCQNTVLAKCFNLISILWFIRWFWTRIENVDQASFKPRFNIPAHKSYLSNSSSKVCSHLNHYSVYICGIIHTHTHSSWMFFQLNSVFIIF